MKLKIGAVEFEGAPSEFCDTILHLGGAVRENLEGIGLELGDLCQKDPAFAQAMLSMFVQVADRVTGATSASFLDPLGAYAFFREDSARRDEAQGNDAADHDADTQDDDPATIDINGEVTMTRRGTCQRGDGDVSADTDTDEEAPAE